MISSKIEARARDELLRVGLGVRSAFGSCVSGSTDGAPGRVGAGDAGFEVLAGGDPGLFVVVLVGAVVVGATEGATVVTGGSTEEEYVVVSTIALVLPIGELILTIVVGVGDESNNSTKTN